MLYRGIKEVSEDYCYAFSKSPWEIYIECIKNDPNFKPFITSNEDIFERAVFDQCKADLYKLEDEVIEHTIKFYSEDKFTRGQLNELHSESFNELSFERKEAFLKLISEQYALTLRTADNACLALGKHIGKKYKNKGIDMSDSMRIKVNALLDKKGS